MYRFLIWRLDWMILMRSNPLLTNHYIQFHINSRYINSYPTIDYELEFLFLYSFYVPSSPPTPYPPSDTGTGTLLQSSLVTKPHSDPNKLCSTNRGGFFAQVPHILTSLRFVKDMPEIKPFCIKNLQGQCHDIFYMRFISWIILPPLPLISSLISTTPGRNVKT
jgi:hypothetical protein